MTPYEVEAWLRARSMVLILGIFAGGTLLLVTGSLVLRWWFLRKKLAEMRKYHGWDQED